MYRLITLFLAVSLFAGVEILNAQGQTSRPNILFIYADDWGWGDLSIHGSPIVKTPNLDNLAKQGTEFYDFSVASGVCSPSRTAIITGNFPSRYGIHAHFATIGHHINNGMPDWLNPDLPHLPKLLQANGYNTVHIGKWHLTNTFIKDAPLPVNYGYASSKVFNGPGPQVKTADVYEETIRCIRENNDQPFFINLWIHETHTPHYPMEKYLKQFSYLDSVDKVYAAVVAEADDGIGRIMQTLDELGLRENTLVIFSSDNGPEVTREASEIIDDASTGPGLGLAYSVGSAGPYLGKKRSLYEGGVRVPFIVSWPGRVPGGRIDSSSVITGVDIYPTLLAVAGVIPPKDHNLDGEDVSKAFFGAKYKRAKPIFWKWKGSDAGYNWPRLAIRDSRWKLLADLKSDKVVLFDMQKTPVERLDEAARHPKIVKALLRRLKRWDDSLPVTPDPNCLSTYRSSGDQ